MSNAVIADGGGLLVLLLLLFSSKELLELDEELKPPRSRRTNAPKTFTHASRSFELAAVMTLVRQQRVASISSSSSKRTRLTLKIPRLLLVHHGKLDLFESNGGRGGGAGIVVIVIVLLT